MDQEWYKEFAHALSQNQTLFEVLTAANYMNIKPLLDLACLEITFKLTGMSAEQVSECFPAYLELERFIYALQDTSFFFV
jgi:S-phase kinase-associated protein 1